MWKLNRKGLEEEMKKDFEKIKTLDDMKDFLLELIPSMIEADYKSSNYVLETLKEMKLFLTEKHLESNKQ